MTISINQMPGCCTANVMSGFGGSRTQGHARVGADHLKKEMTLYILNHWDYEMSRQGVTVALLTTEQTEAIELLRELGWTEVPETYRKPKHLETELMVFTVQCQQLLAWAREYKRDVLDVEARRIAEERERQAAEARARRAAQQQQPPAPVVEEGFSVDFEEEDF